MDKTDELYARMQLRQLVEQYASGADNRSPELFGGAFTEDGVLFTGRGEVKGSAAIAALAPKLGRYKATMHVIGNHYVNFTDSNNATGETYCMASHVYDASGTDRVYLMAIRYSDTYVRVGDGWKMSGRRLNLQWDEDRPLREGDTSSKPS